MQSFKKGTRTPLIDALRRAFFIAKKSNEPGAPPADELIDQYTSHAVHRRRFIGDVTKAGVAFSAAGLLNACKKVTDLAPPPTTINALSKSKKIQPTIAILGAGMAGLNCAYQLQKAGYSSTVYEGATRTGGRMFTKQNLLSQGLYTELGGEFIDSEHKDMLQLCKEFNLSLLDTLTREEAAYARDSFYIDGRFYTEAEVIAAFLPYANRIDADIKSLPVIMTFEQHDANALRFDNMSLTAYLDSIGMTGFLRKGIEVAYNTEYGLENDEQSSINFLYLFSAQTAQGFKIFGSSDERYKVAGGNQSVTTALYNTVKESVQLGQKLVKIKEGISGYQLFFTDANNTTRTVQADIVVCTIPFSILRDVEIDVVLPQWKRNAINNLGYGTNSKLMLGFNSRVWRQYQYSGYVFTNNKLQTGWDNSFGQGGTKGGLTVYGGGKLGEALGTGTPESQAATFVNELNDLWKGCKQAYTGVAKRMHWPTYPFTKGSYACYKVGQYTTIRGAEIKNVGNLFFAGEHCSAYYQGFMNGAAETGRMAAAAIKNAVQTGQLVVMN